MYNIELFLTLSLIKTFLTYTNTYRNRYVFLICYTIKQLIAKTIIRILRLFQGKKKNIKVRTTECHYQKKTTEC